LSSDWKFNGRLEAGRVRCHGTGDLLFGSNRDWARVSGNAAILQKFILYFAIPKGEVINEPNIGCCLHNYIFDKLTDTTLYLLQMEMAAELKEQIPEMGVQRVKAEKAEDKETVKLTVMGYNTWILLASRSDLLDINIINVFQEALK
jgi:phage baseplate assembly protein W